jgi:hypothetical protein
VALGPLHGGSTQTHLGIHHPVGVLDRSTWSRDGENLSRLSIVGFEDAGRLRGTGEACFFGTTLKSVAISGSVRKIGMGVSDFAKA